MIEAATPAVVRALLQRYGITIRKSLGQNFLCDPNIAGKIVEAAGLTAEDLVVEIGPGLGALTVRCARAAGRILAVEVDRALLPALTETLAGASNVEIIRGDALQVDFDELAAENSDGVFGPGARKYKLLGNLPYYITSPLLLHLLQKRFNISLLLAMVQQEVAARLTASPGTRDYGSLSVAVQYFSEPARLFRVPRTVFLPQPKVDSAVVRLMVRPQPAVAVRSEKAFFGVVRGVFGQRRKTLLNSLAGAGLGPDKGDWLAILRQAGIDPACRGETLGLDEFGAIADVFDSFSG